METRQYRTIGVILGEIGELFQSHVWPGIVDTARERETSVIMYSGTIPRTPVLADRELEVIYGMPDAARIDGLIIFSSVLFNFMTKPEIDAFTRRYSLIPVVVISRETGAAPCVLTDNYSGMHSLVEHFIRDHGYRRIAFIRGPEQSVEAEDRFRSYRDALEEHGIPYDEQLVVQGTFLIESGAAAARILIDERKADFDAIIGANDGMIIGALSVLRDRGIAVPGKVAAAGFDDVDEARAHSPAITTVAQSLYSLGRVSCNRIIDMLAGKEVPAKTFVPTRLVTRSSCGCAGETQRVGIGGNRGIAGNHGENKGVFTHWPVVPSDVDGSKEGRPPDATTGKFVNALTRLLDDEIAGKNSSGDFVAVFTDIIGSGVYGESGYGRMKAALDEILSHAERLGPEHGTRASDIIEEARYALTEISGRASNWKLLANQLSIVKRLSKSLSTALSLEGICAALEANLKGALIGECYISLARGDARVDGVIVDPSEESTLVFAFRDGTRISLDPAGIAFRTKDLTPPGFPPERGKGTWIVFPLVFRDENIGFIVFNLPRASGSVFAMEYLHDQLAGALMAIRILDELKETRAKLEATGRMATLGELTAGIAHELKNPMNFVNNFAETIGGYLDEMEHALGEKGDSRLTEKPRAVIMDSIGEIRLATLSILRHGKKASSIIHSMLKQARGDAGRMESVLLNQLLHETSELAWHSARIQYPELRVTLNERLAENLPAIRGNATQLNRVFANLISNAYYALREKARTASGFSGTITIETSLENGWVLASVEDNGTGIPERIRSRLFQPFFTTKPPGEGTGLGLKICREIVVDAHHGTIEATSVEGEFARFTVRLPINAPSETKTEDARRGLHSAPISTDNRSSEEDA